MNAFLQVARLTRPQRLRCRPLLFALPRQSAAPRHLHDSSRPWRRPAAAMQYKKRSAAVDDPDEPIGSEGTVHLRKGDKLDWEVAVEMAEERKNSDLAEARSGVLRKRNPNLPSLSGGRRGGGAKGMLGPSATTTSAAQLGHPDAPRTTSIGQPEEPISERAESEAGPSRSAEKPLPSRKGKEKAIDASGTGATSEDTPVLDGSPQSADSTSQLRRNPVGVQLLSPALHRQLFPSSSRPPPPQAVIDLSLSHLATHGLSPSGAAVLPEISFDMPPLQGSDLREHFQSLGTSTAEPYLSMARQFAEGELPPMPDKWELGQSGWTRYSNDGTTKKVHDLGEESMVSFDVETLYKLSSYPVMAVAASPTAWYSWLSPSLFSQPPQGPDADRPIWDRHTPEHHPHDLIPLFPQASQSGAGHSGPEAGKGSARLVIGHNVGYDRARVLDEYSLDRTSTRWLDTLSLHVATHGITSVQRPAWQKYRKNKLQKREREAEALAVMRDAAEEEGDTELLAQLDAYALDIGIGEEVDGADTDLGGGGGSSAAASEASAERWEDITSINSLAEVAALHCGHKVDKSVRNRFADDSITHASQLVPELESLLTYCAKDVKITHDVYAKVFPLFLSSCPHPATFSGVLSMGSSFLPVDENWDKYLQAAETKYREMDEGVRKALRVLAEKTRKEGRKEGDVWSEQLDWTEKKARWSEEVGVKAMKAIMGEECAPQEDGSAEIQGATATGGGDAAPNTNVVQSLPPLTTASSVPPQSPASDSAPQSDSLVPAWQAPLSDPEYINSNKAARSLLPLLLRLTWHSHPVVFLADHAWCFRVPENMHGEYVESYGEAVHPGPRDKLVSQSGLEDDHAFFRIDKEKMKTKLTGPGVKKAIKDGVLRAESALGMDVLGRLKESLGKLDDNDVRALVKELETDRDGVWAKQLDWTVKDPSASSLRSPQDGPNASKLMEPAKSSIPSMGDTWPKWYWDLTAPLSRLPAGQLDLTTKKSVAPLLLRLQWKGYPLVYSREHKWLFRVPRNDLSIASHGEAVTFETPAEKDGTKAKAADTDPDAQFRHDAHNAYFRLPHKDGDGHNVGNPLSKSFVKAIESGDLASAAAADGQEDDVARKAAADATNMNVLCSYWISSRERIMGQMVVYDEQVKNAQAAKGQRNDGQAQDARRQGMILPQVITMGTVTRRAVEATWLTASNAKKNRVGSELKAMVRAPPGYALVGADVDSEELWISSIMGDSQFGMHGASAIGWMTLEGTKSAGTDLHSKTASILGISRDAAKVFNYSRIYGAGQKHAVQLLLQGDPNLSKEDATKRAEELYKQTKGSKASRNRNLSAARTPSIWHGGSESYLFNTLEAIAHAERPTTPVLGCGVTRALTKGYLETESSFLPSRINWVVQSSGVDYLHLLIVSMEYLIKTYGIQARYVISVHDEVRYLAKEEDQYRTALALQIANAWTRALFCYNLGMDDMPQGVAFFSAVDVDRVLRKEVFMGCETPSHPSKIPEGESLGIEDVLKRTGGSLGDVIAPITTRIVSPPTNTGAYADRVPEHTAAPVSLYSDISSPMHRLFLEAQANEGGAAARAWLDRQAPTESVTGAMVRNTRSRVRGWATGSRKRNEGAKAAEVRERLRGVMKATREDARRAAGSSG